MILILQGVEFPHPGSQIANKLDCSGTLSHCTSVSNKTFSSLGTIRVVQPSPVLPHKFGQLVSASERAHGNFAVDVDVTNCNGVHLGKFGCKILFLFFFFFACSKKRKEKNEKIEKIGKQSTTYSKILR